MSGKAIYRQLRPTGMLSMDDGIHVRIGNDFAIRIGPQTRHCTCSRELSPPSFM